MQTWTLDWFAPYKITSFLYVTNDLVRYVIVDAGGTRWRSINETFPDQLTRNIEKEDLNSYMDIENLNYAHVRFIFVGGSEDDFFEVPPDLLAPGVAVSALQVIDPNQLRFFEKAGSSFVELTNEPISFLDSPSMYGAFFTDDPDEYECVMDKAFTAWSVMNQVFTTKFNNIAPDYVGGPCEGFYKDNPDLGKIGEITSQGFHRDTSKEDVGKLYNAIESLHDTNERAQLSSCPLLY